MQEEKYIYKDEIDLRELFSIIWHKKLFILVFTAIITILSVIYAFSKSHIYEVVSVVKIGHINNTQLENNELLNKKLNIVFNVHRSINKIEKDKAIVSKVSTVKNIDDLIEVSTQAFSNELAINKNKEVLAFLQNEYKSKIDEYIYNTNLKIRNLKLSLEKVEKVERINILNEIKKVENQEIITIETKIKVLKIQKIPSIENQITFIQDIELKSIDNKLLFNNKKIIEYERNIKKSSSNISKNDAIILFNTTQILNLQNKIEDLNKQKVKLLTIVIPQLEITKQNLININLRELDLKKENIKNDKLRTLYFKKDILLKEKEVSLKDVIRQEEDRLTGNYLRNSYIIGKMIINDYPIKENKKLIVTVSFLTAFILSIFLVFFLQFIKSLKEEEIR